jgi:hypothetical protein
MSQHQSHESDRTAAYRGLILGVIVLGILLFTIVRLTNAHYSGAEGAKAASSRSPQGIAVGLDV